MKYQTLINLDTILRDILHTDQKKTLLTNKVGIEIIFNFTIKYSEIRISITP